MDLTRKSQGKLKCVFAIALLGLLVGMAGCSSSRSNASAMRSEGKKVFATPESSAGEGRSEALGWGVVLEHFTSADHVTQAIARRDQLASAHGRGDLHVRSTSSGSAVMLGSHENAADPGAQRDMAWARGLVVGETRPYQRAFLAPPAVGSRGSRPEFNLTGAKKTYGKSAIYTLQIGVWELDDRAKARAEAEREVIRLRQEGQEAFYYHGQKRSMVTVGVFSAADYDAVTGKIDPAVRLAQKIYPHNLLNGEKYRARGESRFVSSALVRIPN